AHFVLAGGEVAAFAGAGPVASDDSTRLDFTVPRSLDSFFGFANASSGGWLVDLMEPGARHDVGLAVFWRKLARMQTFARPGAAVPRETSPQFSPGAVARASRARQIGAHVGPSDADVLYSTSRSEGRVRPEMARPWRSQ